MAKLKSERHHWWPECVSAHWADDEGGVNWLLPDGKVRRSTPNNFGLIGNGHHIKLNDDPTVSSPWDESFESEFQRADDNFPQIINWLSKLARCDPPFERPLAARILPQNVTDEQFADLIECILSLTARSPMYRERGVAAAEHLRGPLPERKRNQIIGLNIRHTHRNALRDIRDRSKIMVIFSPEREFIFGDGFFNNLTIQGQHWHNPKMLVPITPSISALYVRPMSCTATPRLFTLMASRSEADALNLAVQTYSRNHLFYRSEKPLIDEAYARGKHLIFADHRNSVDQLIHFIPGVPPRDTRLDALLGI